MLTFLGFHDLVLTVGSVDAHGGFALSFPPPTEIHAQQKQPGTGSPLGKQSLGQPLIFSGKSSRTVQ